MIDVYYDAQRAVIGCLIIDPKLCAGEIFARIKPEHFSVPEYKDLFVKARELHNESKIDKLVMQHQTPEYRRLITEIVDVTPTAQNYKEYITVLLDEYKLYKTDEFKEKIPELVRKGDVTDIAEALDELKKIFDESNSGRRMVSLEDTFGEFLDEMDKPAEYIDFGFKALRNKLYVEKGDFVVIGARPSVGKTALALNIAHAIAKKYRTAFFSLETTRSKLIARYLANVLNLDFTKVKNRALTDEEKEKIFTDFAKTKGVNLLFDDTSEISAQAICSRAVREGAEVIFIDYLGLIDKPDKRRSDYENVSAISKYLHIFAQKHKVLIIALCQLNREAASAKSPTLAHLRDSGQIEQDADVVMLLHKPKENDSMRELNVVKNKEGETGVVALDFIGKHQRFFESSRASDIFKAIRKASRGAQEAYIMAEVGMEMTEVTDEKELAEAQEVLPIWK